jgi:P-type E1-E2 ATPase
MFAQVERQVAVHCFLDPPKASAGATIQAMAAAGVSVKVLTGDNEIVTRHDMRWVGFSRSPFDNVTAPL